MCRLLAIALLGLLSWGCVESGEESGGQGGAENTGAEGGRGGATPSAEGGAAGAAVDYCAVTEEDDVCSTCVKNKCCDKWVVCLGDCSEQLECYLPCLQDRASPTVEDDTACREECHVADAETQTALIECLLPETNDDDDAGCRSVCL